MGGGLRRCFLGEAPEEEEVEAVRLLKTDKLERTLHIIRTHLGQQNTFCEEKYKAREAAERALALACHSATEISSGSSSSKGRDKPVVSMANLESLKAAVTAARVAYDLAERGRQDLIAKESLANSAILSVETDVRNRQLKDLSLELAQTLQGYQDLQKQQREELGIAVAQITDTDPEMLGSSAHDTAENRAANVDDLIGGDPRIQQLLAATRVGALPTAPAPDQFTPASFAFGSGSGSGGPPNNGDGGHRLTDEEERAASTLFD